MAWHRRLNAAALALMALMMASPVAMGQSTAQSTVDVTPNLSTVELAPGAVVRVDFAVSASINCDLQSGPEDPVVIQFSDSEGTDPSDDDVVWWTSSPGQHEFVWVPSGQGNGEFIISETRRVTVRAGESHEPGIFGSLAWGGSGSGGVGDCSLGGYEWQVDEFEANLTVVLVAQAGTGTPTPTEAGFTTALSRSTADGDAGATLAWAAVAAGAIAGASVVVLGFRRLR